MIRVNALGHNKQKFPLVNKRDFESNIFWNYYTGSIRHENCKHLVDFFFVGEQEGHRPPKYEGGHMPMGWWGVLPIVDFVCLDHWTEPPWVNKF